MADFSARRRLMVDTQVRPNDVTKYPIIAAMLSVPRELFVPAALREAAYVGENIPLGRNRVILEARSFAKMLDALDITPADLVLDIGCGLGYSAAILARLAEAVVAIEPEPAFAAQAQSTLSQEGADNAIVIEADLASGAAKHGPYDVIVVEGGAGEVPAAILDQVKEGGRIGVIFTDGNLGVCRIGRKIDGRVSYRDAFNASAPVLPGFERKIAFAL